MMPPFDLIIFIMSHFLSDSESLFNSWDVDYTLFFSLHYHDLILLYDLHIASNGGE